MYKNKVVFVIGVANGIGNAILKEYAKLNAIVIGIDIVDTKFEEENIIFYRADLKSENEIKVVFEDAIRRYKKIDILINNSAISKFNKSIFDIDISEFDEVIAINLRGSFICAKKFIKANQGQDYGRIVNIA